MTFRKILMFFVVLLSAAGIANQALGQSTLAGDISGTVMDPGGAVIPNATVTVKNAATGATLTAKTNASGSYRLSLLSPGQYTLTATAAGFTTSSESVSVVQGHVASGDIKLSVGASTTTVEVAGGGDNILNTEDANLTTSFTLEQLQNIPNPGGDITYAAQTAPGVVMNTGGGYGNFSAFGLPGTSNNFTVNGMQVNDPFLNLNNSGPSNLLLGLNDIEEVSVVTNAYDPSFGSFGGAQVNATSRSGGNKFHGNARYWWNGDALNANNWFFNNSGTARPSANSNQWAANLSGPIFKDKTFFFVNYEGLKFKTSAQDHLDVPNPTFEAATVGPGANCASAANSTLAAAGNANECSFYNQIFAIYNAAPGYSKGTVDPNNTDAYILNIPAQINLKEQLVTARVDQVIGKNDHAFIHFKYDKGTQPTYNDPIDPVFNITSVQPDYEGQLAETHTFGGKAVNQFLVTGSYYSAIFKSPNQAAANAALPIDLNFSDIDGYFTDLNADAAFFPQGRNVTQYQLADDFSYNFGKHTFKAGVAFKKDDVSDHDTGELTTPLDLTDGIYGDFQSGYVLEGIENFPTNTNVPISLYTLGFYLQDDWKPSSKLIVTAGIRVERNSDPTCKINCLSNLGEDFATLASSTLASPSTAYNKQIHSGLNKAFLNYQKLEVEPRVGFNYSVTPKFIVRGGFGIFTDVFPATIADTELFNPPLTPQFVIYGPLITGNGAVGTIAPSTPGSVNTQAAGANTAFQTGFKNNGSFNSISGANANFVAPSFTTVSSRLNYPTYDEFNLQLQYALSHSESIQIGYVGNNGYHEPVQNENLNAVGLAPFPTAAPPVPSFGEVTQIQSNAVSNYNGLVVSYLHRGHGLTTQINYTYSHNLDEISNGGLLPFSGSSLSAELNPASLRGQYGNSDYNIKHYLNGNLVYTLPYFGGPKVATYGWEISGTIFAHGGLPFTPTQPLGNYLENAGAGSAPVQVAPGAKVKHSCGASNVASVAGGTPCLSALSFYVLPHQATNPSTGSPLPGQPISSNFLGVNDRNQFQGPRYFDTDITLQKAFPLPITATTQLKVGITGYNILNHPNFGNPVADVTSPYFGLSTGTVSPPTSIYGAFLGGDASVRIFQIQARFDF